MSIEIDTEESALKYALSAVKGGVQYKRSRMKQGPSENKAREQAGRWVKSVILSSGADLEEVHKTLREQQTLARILADDLGQYIK